MPIRLLLKLICRTNNSGQTLGTVDIQSVGWLYVEFSVE